MRFLKEFLAGLKGIIEISKHIEYLLSLNDEIAAAQKKEAEDIATILSLLRELPCTNQSSIGKLLK
jgi:hypothetical protein